MTAEEWENAARNSWITQIGRNDAPFKRTAYVPSNGYQTSPPQYNSYWSQRQNLYAPYRRTDYTQPIQNSQPINQALNENFQPQPQTYVRTTDYAGRPIIYPVNAPAQAAEYVSDWAKSKAIQKGMMLGAGGLAISAPLISTRIAMSTNPTVQRLVSALESTRLGRPIVKTARNIANNPYVQKVDRAIGKIGDCFY